jgi:MFS family permease
METTKKKKFHYGYLIVLSCFIGCFAPVALVFSCAGIFYRPVSASLGVGMGTLTIYMTAMGITSLIFMPFAGKLLQKLDVRIVLSAAAILVGGSLIAMSFFTEVWMFYVAGILMGLGEPFFLNLGTPVLVNRWFRKNVGLLIGIGMTGTGIGGIIFNPIGGALIASGPEGWRTAYLVFGALVLILTLPFTLFVVRSNPSDKGLLPFGMEETVAGDAKAAIADGITAGQAMKTPTFYALALCCGLMAFTATIFQYLPAYISSFELTAPAIAALAATVVSVVMAGQIVGKIVLGFINDRSVTLGLLSAVICCVVGLLAIWQFTSIPVVLLIGAFLFGVFYPSSAIVIPVITTQSFGTKDYSNVYSRIMLGMALLSAFAAPTLGFIVDSTGGNYSLIFIIGLVLAAIITLLGLFGISSGKKIVKTTE